MQNISIFLVDSAAHIVFGAGGSLSIEFQKGTNAALARNVARAEVHPGEADQTFPADKWHKVPKSQLEFSWRKCANGYVEVDFRERRFGKRLLYKDGGRPRVKRL